jgi:hypothetical protein
MRAVALIACIALALSGCYSRRTAGVSPGEAEKILQRDGFTTHKINGGVDSSVAWQRPNNAPSVFCFGLTFTHHRVANGQVVSQTYGWALIPGLFFILPGFLVNLPVPLEDETNRALTASPK